MKKFSVNIAHDPSEVVSNIKTAAKKNGIHFIGNTDAGHFSGKGIQGKYAIHEQTLLVTIEKKPIFLSWPMIEAKLREFFEYQGSA